MEPKNLVSNSRLILFDFFLLSLKHTIPAKYWKIENTSIHFLKLNLIILFSFLGLNLFSQSSYNIKDNNGQTISTCGGTFYDSGGASENYSDNEDYTVIFCSQSGENLKFDFSNVFIRSGDFLTVYNGPDISSPVLGTYSGDIFLGSIPDFSVVSSGTCLTFNFKSNGSFNRSGWNAIISCISCIAPITGPIIPSTTPVCAGTTITYSVVNHPGSTYNWTVTYGTPSSVIGGTNTLDVTWDYYGNLSGQVRVDEINACGQSDFSIIPVDIYPRDDVNFTGLNFTYCLGDSFVTLSGTPSGGVFSGPGISGNTFTPLSAGLGTHNIIYTYTNPVSNCIYDKVIQTTVNENSIALTPSSGSDNQTVCINTPLNNITYATMGATGATFSGLPAGVTGTLAGNIVTISGSPGESAGSPYNYTVTLTGGCGTITANGTIKVTPDGTITLTSASATTNQTVCVNSSIIDITYSTTEATDATVTGLPTGVTGTWSANVVTITGTPTGSGTFPYIVALTGCCGSVTATGTINVNPIASVSNQTATTCSGIAFTVAPAGVPAGTTYTWTAPVITGGITGGSAQAVGQASISQTLTNTTLVAQTATYTVTPTSGTCAGATFTVTVTVNPTPSVSNQTATTCSGSAFTVAPAGVPAGTTYTWTAPVVTGGITGGSAQAVGQASISQTLTNTTLVAQTATYTVTPTSGTCAGATFTVTVTVNPTPSVSNQTASTCSGSAFTVAPAGVPAGTTYTWTAPVVTGGITGGSAQAVGQVSVSQTLTNTTLVAQTATYTVTPTSGTCAGATFTVTVTVNPTPSVSNQTATTCSGSAFTVAPAGVPAGTTYTWTAPVITGGITGGSAQAVGQVSVSQTLTNTTLVAQTATYTVTPTSGTCAGATFTVTVTVNPTPSVSNQTATTCSGSAFTVAPAGVPAGTTYTWTAPVVTAGITGGSAKAVGQASISQTLTNTTLVAQTATYTVTPTSGTCAGATFTVTVTVNPTPSVSNQTATTCSGSAFTVAPAGVPAGTTYTWTAPVVTGGITGGSAQAVGQASISQTLTNTTLVAQTATYTVTPTSGTCAGATFTVTVTVNPTPSVSNQTATTCSGSAFTVAPAGVPASTTYTWTAPVVTGGITGGSAQAVGQASISQTLTNTTLVAQTATYTVTPTSGTCAGATFTVTVTVNPTPSVSNQTASTCSGSAFTVAPAGVPAGTTYTWTAPVVTGGITGGSAQAVGQVSVSQTLTNTTLVAQTATYTVTPTSGTCAGATFTLTVTVNPTNSVSLTSSAGTEAQIVCINTVIADITYATTGATGATVTGLPAGVSGTWLSDLVTISGTPTASGPFTYTITLTGGCGIVTSTGIIVVTPDNTVNVTSSAGTDAQTVCINTAITDITYATNGATGATIIGLPAGVTGSWAADVVTITGTPTASGLFTYTVTLTGGCGVVTVTGTVNVALDNSVTLTSATGTDAQSLCGNVPITDITYATTGATGAVITGLPGGVTGVWTANVITISGSPTLPGTSDYTITLTGGCGVVFAKGTITVNSVPLLVITNPMAQCSPSTVDLTAAAVTAGSTPGLDYTYWTDALATVPYSAPTSATANTYYIKGADPVTSCFDIKPVTVSIHPVPTVIVTDPVGVCTPLTVDLTAASVTAGSVAGLNFSYWTDPLATIPYTTPGNATAGTYYIKGTDPLTNCSDIKPVKATVHPLPNITITNPSGCDPSTVDLTALSVTAGSTAGLTYYYWTDALATIAYATPATSVAGVYYIEGVDPVTGCKDIKPVTVTINPTLTVSTTKVDAVCFNGTGTATAIAGGGSGVYSYSWNTIPVQTTSIATDLTSGTYIVTIADGGNCTATASVTITQPATELSGSIISKTNVPLQGGNNGSFTVEGSGGTPPYMYSLNGGAFQLSGTFGTLTAGTYSVAVRDINLCSKDVTVTIIEPSSPLSGSIINPISVACFGNSTGSFTVEGSGGLVPYEYSLDGINYQSSGTFGSLPAGNYTLTIRDAGLITYKLNAIITQPASALAISVDSLSNVLCYGGNSGKLTVSGSGGTSPYLYRFGSGSFQSSGTFNSVSAGLYTVSIQDANLCPLDLSVNIGQPLEALMGTVVSKSDVSCSGFQDGSVTISGSGGTGPYLYSINNGAYQVSGTFSNLAAAVYTLSVQDANLCISNVTATLTEPAILSIASTSVEATCRGVADGSIALTVTGGTQPNSVIWSDGVISQDRAGITDGTYSVVVTDKNGCAASLDVILGFGVSEICIEIPDIITPNNDGFNDTWKIRNIDLFPNAEVFVFTRWGKQVFNTKNLAANPWNGTYKGSLLPTDSYHYVLYLNDGSKPRSGVISIIR